ncbi:MAG: hypothetical protein A2X48_02025 [Lentisphaerae bacterium GWF2_49_21]|nr:MAG: hypothetical protein A2X48_02025 [Lentisphaerae bacterium GWF2_49_21]
MKKLPEKHSSSDFTLIELLVVVAIIAILAALLLPALKNALMVARSTQCLTQLKQVGQWGMTYTMDYNDFLPTNGVDAASGVADSYYWECGDERWFEKFSISGYYSLKKWSQQSSYMYRCPQASVSLAVNDSLKGQAGDDHYQLKTCYSLHMWRGGGYNSSAKAKMPMPKVAYLKPENEWFADGRAKWYSDGPGGGKGGGYYFDIQFHHSSTSYPLPWMWYNPELPGHSPSHGANMLYGDLHAETVPR